MFVNIEGIIDNMILYRKQKSTDSAFNYTMIEKNIKKYDQIIVNNITQIIERVGYYIDKKFARRIILKNKHNEKIILYYDLLKDKVNATYFLNAQIDIEFKDISPEILLLIDYIYTFLENNTKSYKKWKISYMGNTNNKHIIRDDIVKIYANSIILCHEPRKDKKMDISNFLREIADIELKKDKIYRGYIKKKNVLKELEEQIDIIYRIPINSKERFNFKEKEIVFRASPISYNEVILKPDKVGTINTILEEEKVKIASKEIRNINIYKVANVSQKRKKKCYLYYVIDILYKDNAISKNNTLYGNQKPYLRLYSKEEINKEELLEIVRCIKDDKNIEIKW